MVTIALVQYICILCDFESSHTSATQMYPDLKEFYVLNFSANVDLPSQPV